MTMTAEPSPASASSSTLIATPSTSASKLALHIEEPMALAAPLPTNAGPLPSDATHSASPRPPSTPTPPSKQPQRTHTPSQLATGLGLGILNTPTAPMRSISTPTRRALSVTASTTRLSEKGFVEPHHSNLPRRTLTQTHARRRTGTGSGLVEDNREQERVEQPPPPSPLIAAHEPPPPVPQRTTPPAPDLSDPFENQPTTPRDTPNPNVHRMPTHLLSLRLPPSPTRSPPPSSSPFAVLSLPSSMAASTPPISGTAQGLQQQTPKGTLGGSGAPGSAQLPRRRTIRTGGRGSVSTQIADKATPKVEVGDGQTKPPSAEEPVRTTADGRARAPNTSDAGLPPHPASAPATFFLPPLTSYASPYSRRRIHEEKRKAKEEQTNVRREQMGLQMVGATSRVELGFLEVEMSVGEGGVMKKGSSFEEIDLGDEEKAKDAKEEVKNEEERKEGLYVLLCDVSSDSEDDEDDEEDESEWSSSSNGASRLTFGRKNVIVEEQGQSDADTHATTTPDAVKTTTTNPTNNMRPQCEELRLPLPTSSSLFVDGQSALGPAQIRDGVRFIRRVLGAPSIPSQRRVRILTPRGRPEDAMVLALAYIAYGEGGSYPSTSSSSSLISIANASPAGGSGDETPNTPSPPPAAAGAARLLLQTASAADVVGDIPAPLAGIAARRSSIALDGRMIDVVVDVIGSSSSSGSEVVVEVEEACVVPVVHTLARQRRKRRVYSSFLYEDDEDDFWAGDGDFDAYGKQGSDEGLNLAYDDDEQQKEFEEGAYTPVHRVAMHLLDEGDWLSANPNGSTNAKTNALGGLKSVSASTTSTSGVEVLDTVALDAGRGVVGAIGVIGVGKDEDDESQTGSGWEEGSGGASRSTTSDEEKGEGMQGSACGRPTPSPPDDGHDGRRGRRGRKIAWHGVPMPAKFVEASEESEGQFRTANADGKSKSKSKSCVRTGAKSKSKSRTRRSRSLYDARRSSDLNPDDAAARAHARVERRAAKRAEARREREKERIRTYAGIGTQWRGVLSYEGLCEVARAMRRGNRDGKLEAEATSA